jgi:drug/metabolite transporter (DMT)-like permease
MGEVFSLLTAILWGFAVIYYKKAGDKISPIALNPFKTIIGFILFFITIKFLGEPMIQPVGDGSLITKEYYWRLILSGIIGVGIADAIFFKALNILGAGLTAIVDCLYSPTIIVLAYFMLGERLGSMQIVGAIIILGAIFYAAMKIESIKISRKDFKKGIFLAWFSFLLMGWGIVIIKPILTVFSDDIKMQIWISGFRLFPGIIISLIILAYFQRKSDLLTPFKNKKIWKDLIIGSVIGSYVAVAFWIIGIAKTSASIASILNQTSAIFLFVFSWLILKEPITKRRIISLAVAMIGVFIVVYFNPENAL